MRSQPYNVPVLLENQDDAGDNGFGNRIRDGWRKPGEEVERDIDLVTK